MSSVLISLCIIVGVYIVLSLLIMRNYHIYILAIASAFLICLFTGIDLMEGLKVHYLGAFVEYFQNNFLIFLAGSLLGKAYEITSGAKAVARMIIHTFGPKASLIAVPVACGILVYGGVSVFVVAFAVFPVALEIFREAGYPRRFIPAALMFGSETFAMVAPGAPQVQNYIPASILGTDLMAGTMAGFISQGVVFVVGVLLLIRMVNRACRRGEKFVAKPMDKFRDEAKLPSGFLPLVPLIFTLLIVNVKIGGKLIVPIEFGVFLGACMTILLLNKYQNNKELLFHAGEAAKNSVTAITNTCSIIGFAGVVKATPVFPAFVDAMLNIPGPPYLGVAIGITLMAAFAGSGSGGLGIIVPVLAPLYVAQGVVSPEAFHRIATISCSALDTMPYNGYVITVTNAVCGESHKDAYWPTFWLTVVTPIIGMIVAVIIFSLFPYLP